MYNRKRQRRQAAAVVVESLWSNNNNNHDAAQNNANGNPTTRRSTAQPRPVLNIPPRGIGPIADPNENDVLCGRGGRINSHAGNIQFRDIIDSKKNDYLAPTTKKLEKAHIAAGIVNDIRAMDPPGRFLKKEKEDKMWYDIGDQKAIKKTGQALREDAPEIRPGIEGSRGQPEVQEGTNNLQNVNITANNQLSPNVSSRPAHIEQVNAIDLTYDHDQIWPEEPIDNDNTQRLAMNQDYLGQSSMPPPVSQRNRDTNYALQLPLPQQQFIQNHSLYAQQQGFETRNIPLQMPAQAQNSDFTTRIYAGAQSSTYRMGSMSQRVCDALSNPGPSMQQPQYRLDENEAFGMAFHEPIGGRSTNDDLSSLTAGSGTGRNQSSSLRSSLSNRSSMSNTNSFRLSNLMSSSNRTMASSGPVFRGSNSRFGFDNSSLMNGSIKSGFLSSTMMDGLSTRSPDPLSSIGLLFPGSLRSGSGQSLTRSNSFSDGRSMNMSMKFNSEEMIQEEFGDSSAMSIGSMMGMSTTSSQLYTNTFDSMPPDFDGSANSNMSANINALDLAF
mmetsp:Transcript_9126/g.20918  ORF Transcript_9126/g.20918 Transcript_9126/m.20918 type:complete len:554 (+) Transcript_9126:291-1952(+)